MHSAHLIDGLIDDLIDDYSGNFSRYFKDCSFQIEPLVIL